MNRLRFAIGIAAALMLCAAPASLHAADKKSKSTATSTTQEIEALKQIIEEQSKQIAALTEQVAHLTQLLENHPGVSAATPPPPVPLRPAPSTETPAPVAATGTSATQAAPETPGVHIVAKGETLTSIAKHYKITVGELLKVNKIENDRMLQIGQSLVIPIVTPSPTPSTPQEKTENP